MWENYKEAELFSLLMWIREKSYYGPCQMADHRTQMKGKRIFFQTKVNIIATGAIRYLGELVNWSLLNILTQKNVNDYLLLFYRFRCSLFIQCNLHPSGHPFQFLDRWYIESCSYWIWKKEENWSVSDSSYGWTWDFVHVSMHIADIIGRRCLLLPCPMENLHVLWRIPHFYATDSFQSFSLYYASNFL